VLRGSTIRADAAAIHIIRKLEQFTRLSAGGKRALEQAATLNVRPVSPNDLHLERDGQHLDANDP